MGNEFPAAITANKQTCTLLIDWKDGHHSEYPFALVRAACPCASCRGGHENMSSEPDAAVFDQPLVESEATRIRRIEAAGTYAITIEWEDGHHFGIYTWHFLRELCPCPVCRGQ